MRCWPLTSGIFEYSTCIDGQRNISDTYPYICDQSATTPTLLPAAIEISFNAMSPQAARTVMSVSSSADRLDDRRTSISVNCRTLTSSAPGSICNE